MDDLIDVWKKRVTSAQKAHEAWKTEYEVDVCHDYFRGNQRKKTKDKQGDKLMIVNRILPAIRTALPSLYFREPFAKVLASPARMETTAEQVDQRAQLLQDTGNSIVKDPDTMFKDQTFISMKEGFWTLPCVEVGYTADFTEHPAAEGKPPLEEKEGEADSDDMILTNLRSELDRLVTNERFYVRRIDPDSLLIPDHDTSILAELPWVGYTEKLYIEDIKKAPAYSAVDSLEGGEEGQIDVHKIWDQRTFTRYVFADKGTDFLLKQPFKRTPLFFLRFEIDPGKFRPIPLIYSWLQSQDEYNDSREFLRKNRKARQTRFTVDGSKIKPDEVEKFRTEEVEQYAFTEDGRNDGQAIRPVEQPPMDGSVIQTLTISRSEFDEVSGKSAQSRQVATGDTATEAGLVNARQVALENFDRVKVADWLAAIIRELILQAVDKMSLTRWVVLNADPFSDFFLTEGLQIAKVYRQIVYQQLTQANDSLRWDVTVDIESISAVPEAQKKADWMQMLMMISNPQISHMLAISPDLLKETLELNGIRSARKQAAIAQALGVQALQAANAPAPPGVPSMPAAGPGPGFVPPPTAVGPRPGGPIAVPPPPGPSGPPRPGPIAVPPSGPTAVPPTPMATRALSLVPGASAGPPGTPGMSTTVPRPR